MDLAGAEEATFRANSAGRRVGRKRYVAYRKAYAGLGTAANARDQRSGRVTANGMASARAFRVASGRASRSYVAPRTRLY
jgi:type IV secretory pathway TrbL component